jgi:N-acetylglucosaminyl-diphospho-decaprenol L-rhamnosyltransferase
MSCSVVVVVHDSRADLVRLLGSLAAHVPGDHQLIVVDSGSTDDGPEAAREWGAELVTLDGNPGFGAANNAGIARARHPVTVLVNPDVVALDDGLATLAALPAARDALFAPRLLNEDRTVQRSAHALPGTWRELLPALVHPRALPPAVRLRTDPWRAEAETEVGWAIAACLAGRTETLRRLGPFDPSAFLYAEDLDLCLRARAAGVPTILRPDVALVHTGGTSADAAFGGEPLALKAERRRLVVAANLGARALARDDAAQALTFATRAGARLALRRDATRERAQLAALRAARRAGPPG